MAELTVTKKVRLGRKEAAALRRLARSRHVTESEILREGLGLVEASEARDALIARLCDLFPGAEPDKEPFELR